MDRETKYVPINGWTTWLRRPSINAGTLLVLVIVAAYAARPMSCWAALVLETRPVDDPRGGVDPHGFGVLGAMISAAAYAIPVLWIMLGRRVAALPVPPARLAWRSVAMLVTLGTPTLMQMTYMPLPMEAAWPVLASSVLWMGIVALSCLTRGTGLPSLHGSFDRAPRTSWLVVGAIAVAKFGLLTLL